MNEQKETRQEFVTRVEKLRKQQYENIDLIKEAKNFWKDVYLISLQTSKSHITASGTADLAYRSFEIKFITKQ